MPVPGGCAFLIEPIPEKIFTKEDFTDEQREMARTAEAFIEGDVLPFLPDIG